MKINVLAHGNTSVDKVMLMYKTVKFYAKYLNINKFNYQLYVCSAPNLRKKEGYFGVASKTGDREISIAIDSQLDLLQLLNSLAHEMVHVKQYIRGQYKAELSKNGKLKRFWLGKLSKNLKYHERPWEIDAFSREGELSFALIEHVARKAKKS